MTPGMKQKWDNIHMSASRKISQLWNEGKKEEAEAAEEQLQVILNQMKDEQKAQDKANWSESRRRDQYEGITTGPPVEGSQGIDAGDLQRTGVKSGYKPSQNLQNRVDNLGRTQGNQSGVQAADRAANQNATYQSNGSNTGLENQVSERQASSFVEPTPEERASFPNPDLMNW
jgi:hypothetical protein